MTQKTTIILGSVGLIIILLTSMVYWQNKPNTTEKIITPPRTNTSTGAITQNATSTPTNTTDATAQWNTHTQLGIRVKYPNDGTYTIETPEATRFVITEKPGMNRIHMTQRDVPLVPTGSVRTKVIQGNLFQQFEVLDGGYGYMIEKNGTFYTFESVLPRTNDMFELIMTTVEFESK